MTGNSPFFLGIIIGAQIFLFHFQLLLLLSFWTGRFPYFRPYCVKFWPLFVVPATVGLAAEVVSHAL